MKFGVIGTSTITERWLDAAKQIEGFELVAVYSRTKNRAEEFAAIHGAKYTFTSLEEMSLNQEMEAVYVASPNSFHAEHSKIMMKAKKHVLCEKPLASNLREVEEMIETANSNKVLLMEAMITSYLPRFQAIRDSLSKIAPIRRFVGSYCQYSSRYDKYKAGEILNAFNPEFSNGSLMDIGVYTIHPLVQILGKPNSIKAHGTMLDSGVDGEGHIAVQYEDCDGILYHSKICDSHLPSEIQGEGGQIIIDKLPLIDRAYIKYRNGECEEIDVSQDKSPMYYETKGFIDLINSNKLESDINSYSISRDVMSILDESRNQIGLKFRADNKI